MNKYTLKSAETSYKDGKIDEWIYEYLLNDGNNEGLAHGLKLEKRHFLRPIKFPLNLVNRCCGPEKNMSYIVDETDFNIRVKKIENILNSDFDMPPLIVNYDKGNFHLNDGNHRHEAFNRLGIEKFWAIIWITSKCDYDDFMKTYGEYYKD